MSIKKFLIFGFAFNIFFTSTCLFPGLILGTKITTTQGLVPIERLTTDDKITGFDASNKSFPELPIKNIALKEVQGFYAIITDKGIIQASEDQLFYEVVRNDYLKTEQLNPGDIFLTKDQQPCLCLGIEYQESPAQMYDLTLAEPHTFFSSEIQLLTHNYLAFVASSSWIVNAFAAWLGFCVGMVCLYNDKPTNILTSIEQLESKITSDRMRFCAEYYFKDGVSISKNSIFPENFSRVPQQTCKQPTRGGVNLDFKLYQESNVFYLRYGQFYHIATMTSTGQVICIVAASKVIRRETEGGTISEFTQLGKALYVRNDPFVKIYVEAEDNAQLNCLKNHIKTWPQELTTKLFSPTINIAEKTQLRTKHGCFEKVIYGVSFGIDALYRMVEKNLSPSLVLQTVHQDRVSAICSPTITIYVDQKEDIAVLYDKQAKKVINVSNYKDSNDLDEKKAEEKRKEEQKKEKEKERTEGAQAPGKPTKEDGFEPPKRWDGKKVCHPRTGQYGWPDNKGNIWVPTGPGSLAHGGPHWDVVDKNGDYENVVPGGRIRGQK